MNLDVEMVFIIARSLEAFVVHYVLDFLQNVYVYWEETNLFSCCARTKKAFLRSVIQKLLHL
jgi:hypothetical protein